MLDLNPPFRAIRRREGYVPLEDMGLIGDGNTTALVGLDGMQRRPPWIDLDITSIREL